MSEISDEIIGVTLDGFIANVLIKIIHTKINNVYVWI